MSIVFFKNFHFFIATQKCVFSQPTQLFFKEVLTVSGKNATIPLNFERKELSYMFVNLVNAFRDIGSFAPELSH